MRHSLIKKKSRKEDEFQVLLIKTKLNIYFEEFFGLYKRLFFYLSMHNSFDSFVFYNKKCNRVPCEAQNVYNSLIWHLL